MFSLYLRYANVLWSVVCVITASAEDFAARVNAGHARWKSIAHNTHARSNFSTTAESIVASSNKFEN